MQGPKYNGGSPCFFSTACCTNVSVSSFDSSGMDKRLLLAIAFVMGAGLRPPTAQTPLPPPVQQLSEQQLLDLLLGSSIQASRGANTAQTVDRLKAALAQGRTFSMIDVDDLPSDWTTVTVAGVGGGGDCGLAGGTGAESSHWQTVSCRHPD